MKIVKIKNPQDLVARLNYPTVLDPVNIDDADTCYTRDANGVLRPLTGFYKGKPIYFTFAEDSLEPVS